MTFPLGITDISAIATEQELFLAAANVKQFQNEGHAIQMDATYKDKKFLGARVTHYLTCQRCKRDAK